MGISENNKAAVRLLREAQMLNMMGHEKFSRMMLDEVIQSIEKIEENDRKKSNGR